MPHSDLTVMIIDDQKAMRSILRQLLNDAGIYDIIEGENGENALDVLGKAGDARPDVIVCDLHMDRMDGMEFVNRLRRNKDITPVLMLTGDTDRLMRDVSLQIGVAKFLNKPISSADLFKEICAAVGYQE